MAFASLSLKNPAALAAPARPGKAPRRPLVARAVLTDKPPALAAPTPAPGQVCARPAPPCGCGAAAAAAAPSLRPFAPLATPSVLDRPPTLPAPTLPAPPAAQAPAPPSSPFDPRRPTPSALERVVADPGNFTLLSGRLAMM
jgi:hypothetical protein